MKEIKAKKERIRELEQKLHETELEKTRLEADMSIEEKEMRIKFTNYEKNLN